METLERFLEFISDVFDIVEQFLLGLVAKSATWLSPMIPAIFIYSSVQAHFGGLPDWSCYLIAYVIEALGLTTIMNTMNGWQQWQRDRTKVHGWALGIAGLTALFYVVLNILLVIVLKVYPSLATWGIGLLTVVSVVAGVTTVMRVWQSDRADEIRRARRHQEMERQENRQLETERRRQEFALELELKRAEHAQRLEIERRKVETKLETNRLTVAKKHTVNEPEITHVTPVDDSDLTARLLEVYSANPMTSLRKAGSILGLSHTGVKKKLNELVAAGTIHRNGNGVEIL